MHRLSGVIRKALLLPGYNDFHEVLRHCELHVPPAPVLQLLERLHLDHPGGLLLALLAHTEGLVAGGEVEECQVASGAGYCYLQQGLDSCRNPNTAGV